MAVRWAVAVVFACMLVPGVHASPLEEACQTVADNPYAPQPADCRRFGDVEEVAQDAFAGVCQDVNEQAGTEVIVCEQVVLLMDDPVAFLEGRCRWVADNPWMPLLLGCEF